MSAAASAGSPPTRWPEQAGGPDRPPGQAGQPGGRGQAPGTNGWRTAGGPGWPLAARLVTLGPWRSTGLALAAAIAVTDRVFHQQQLSFVPRALMDEPCHLATALIVLGALTRWRGHPPGRSFTVAMLASSVLIDVDHLPLAFGSAVLTAGTPRPYTHALWLPAGLAGAAVLARRRARVAGRRGATRRRATLTAAICAGAAWGLGAHFLRDVATAPIALWWPVSSAGVQMPHPVYLAALVMLAVLPPPALSRARAGGGR